MVKGGKRIVIYCIIVYLCVMFCACGQQSTEESTVTLKKEDTSITFCVDEKEGQYPILIPEFESQVESAVVSSINSDIKDILMPVYEQKQSGKNPCIDTEIYDSDRYLQVVSRYAVYPLEDGYEKVVSFNYDRVRDKRITLTDALIESGTTLDEIRQEINDYFVSTYNEIATYGVTVDGFRIDDNNACVFLGNVCLGTDNDYTLYVYAFDYSTGRAELYDNR